MQGRSILIRADGSPTLGMGHISRCVALAQTCANCKIKVFFACRDAAPEVREVINSAGYQLLNIDTRSHDIQDEASAIAKLANKNNVRWLIIDHPDITIEHETLINQYSSSEIIVIDGQFRNHQCDVLVNPNAFATTKNCRNTVPSECQILAGYQYFVLNDNYLIKRTSATPLQETDNRCRILITLGGSDPENCTLKICHALAEAHFGNHEPVFDIVVGPTNIHRPSISNFLNTVGSKKFAIHDAPDNLVDLLQACTLCVSAGGITLGEAAYLGKPIIGVAILENQHRTIESLEKVGALQIARTSDIASHCKNLLDNFEMRKLIGARASALVDGLGKQRIANSVWNSSTSEC